jgi:hypothetical protein
METAQSAANGRQLFLLAVAFAMSKANLIHVEQLRRVSATGA